MPATSAPFAPGSVSLRCYPHLDLPAPQIVDELRAQAALAVEHGFDGVMTSEHHGGFAGYLPNPLQTAGFALDAMPTGWAAPCPLLLPLRPAALVIEETAWLAARHPGRVGLGVAAGALPIDFEIMGTTMDDLTAALRGRVGARRPRARRRRRRARSRATPRSHGCRDHPIPVLSAAGSATAARRAAAVGAGLVFDSLSTPARCRELVDAYRAAGGTGPCVLIRRAWIGEPPTQLTAQQVDTYRSYAPAARRRTGAPTSSSPPPTPARSRPCSPTRRATAGADALNLRVHVAGVTPADARAQIERLGDDAVPAVRDALYRGATSD